MRRIRVQLDFTIDVEGDRPGIPEGLIHLSWLDVVSFGLSSSQWESARISGVNRGHRKLTDVGDPCKANDMTQTSWRKDKVRTAQQSGEGSDGE